MGTKKWWQSKTIWAAIIAGISFLLSSKLGVQGLDIPENADFNQVQAAIAAIHEAHGNIGVIVTQIVGIVSTLATIIFRVQSGAKITK